jgi:hypothetical protein
LATNARILDLHALNALLKERSAALYRQIVHARFLRTVADIWTRGVASLMPLGWPFDGFVERSKPLSPTCLVHFERNRKSEPAPFANRPIGLRIYPQRIVIAAEGHIPCEHARIIERSHLLLRQTVYDWWHYLAVIQRKPNAMSAVPPWPPAICPSTRGLPSSVRDATPVHSSTGSPSMSISWK